MRLVLAALSRPLSVIVALLAIVAGFVMALGRMPMDIFPQVGNPVIYVAQPYGGMNPAQMEGYLTYYYEYHFLYITGIQSVDSKSVQGAALMKLTFREGTNMEQALAETVGYVNRARAFMPPGTVPPFITRFDPGSLAVGLLLFSSSTHSQGELQNFALNQVRPLFATLPGVSAPPPFGGNQRTIVVNLDPDKLKQYGISPEQAIAAVSSGTVVVPSGNLYDGSLNRIVRTNSALGPDLAELMNTPIHPRSGANIYLRDIGTVENGTDIVTAYAHVDGKRTVYIPVTKRSNASTLAVIAAVKAAIPRFKKAIPGDVDVQLAFDQSGYVSNAISGLVKEALIGALLAGLVVFLFLRDWRGALIVVANIPFALFTAVIALWASRQTLNIMTLGGLALAVGVLVDEATVEIENIHTHLLPGVSQAKAVFEACRRTIIARLLSMLCVLAVFVPSFFMKGVGRQLFTPLSLAVGFAMIASYLLSSTLVPVFAVWFMSESHCGEETEGRFGRLKYWYERYLTHALRRSRLVVIGYFAICALLLFILSTFLGTEIFPDANGPVLRMRIKAPIGTRIEETEPQLLQALDLIRNTAGEKNVAIVSDYMGVQPSSYPVNLIHLFTAGPEEAIVQVQLAAGHPNDERLREDLRVAFQKQMPNLKMSFEGGDIVSQVMSFGSPTPVQIDVQGVDLDQDYTYLSKIEAELKKLPFLRDLSIVQAQQYPTAEIKIDRDYAGQFGLSMADVATSLIPATGSSRFTAPNYWRDPRTGNAFQIQVQLPSNRIQGLAALSTLPLMRGGQSQPQLDQVASLQTGTMPEMIERLSGQRIVSVTANLHGIALGDAQKKINDALKNVASPPKGVAVVVRGQIPALEDTIAGLRIGLLLAIATIFLLLMANFQSLRLPLAVLSTVPGVLIGVMLMLLLTGTTLNIQSFMGTIMAVGISVANSILLVSFAEHARHENNDIAASALYGATSRLRAILMTATAMISGMLPMAIGFGEGGAQSAPLGRAVVGGFCSLRSPRSLFCRRFTPPCSGRPILNPTHSTPKTQRVATMHIRKSAIALLPFCFHIAFGQNATKIAMAKVEGRSLSRTVPLTAALSPFLQTDIEARVPGYVERVLVDRGSKVRRGQVLVVLSAPEMGSQIGASEANVLQAEADVAQAKAAAAGVASTYERLLEAAKTPGAVAGNELIQGQKQKEAADAVVQAREASVKAASSQLRSTQEMQAYLRVTAPFDGIITERLVHPGMMVASGNHQALLRLQQSSHLRLVVPVPETYAGNLTRGKQVAFHVPAHPGKAYSGVIARIPESLDPQSRAMMVELDVLNRDGSLAPGMYPTVDWPVSSRDNLLFVPTSSVVTTTEHTFVIVPINGRAHWVNVRKGPVSGEQIAVRGKLSPGQFVVKQATDEIREGTSLR